MMVMIADRTGIEVGYLAGRYPDCLGHLYSPGDERGPFHFMPYALDNGAWPAFLNKEPWSEAEWRRLVMWSAMSGQRPLWALVPDVVADRSATIASYHRHVDHVRRFGFRPAFALQDGMTFEDVPDDDCVLFLGGSTDWKEAAIEPWCRRFAGRVHVGRVNKWDRLWRSYKAGAISVDGTGWFRKKGGQAAELRRFIEHIHNERKAA